MEGLGKLLIIVGVVIAVVGILLVLGQYIPFFGKLPGDLVIKGKDFSVCLPIVTFLLISIVLTVIINIVIRIWGK
jgi:hypothetical protein